MKRFEEEMEKFKKDHTIEVDPLPVLQIQIERAKEDKKFFLPFVKEHEKKLIRNLIGIEKESNLKLRHSVLKDLDNLNAY